MTTTNKIVIVTSIDLEIIAFMVKRGYKLVMVASLSNTTYSSGDKYHWLHKPSQKPGYAKTACGSKSDMIFSADMKNLTTEQVKGFDFCSKCATLY